jgi:multiple sugar transport system substrate-binding protein
MSNSQHKDAALAFIDWWEKPETLLKIYEALGLLPCRQGVLSTLQEEGKLAGGDVLVEELNYVSPLFPGGAPTWYSQFSTEASSLINSAAKGDITVDQAIKEMADTMRSLSGA